MIAGEVRSQESLTQAVGAILVRQLVAFLAIWLAVGFPVTCQVHGTMSMYELEQHDHMGAETEYPCAIHNHNTAPSMTMLLSLITSMVPDQIAYHDVSSIQVLPVSIIRWPLQFAIHPPGRPPRSV